MDKIRVRVWHYWPADNSMAWYVFPDGKVCRQETYNQGQPMYYDWQDLYYNARVPYVYF